MHQDDRRSVARDLVVERRALDRREAALIERTFTLTFALRAPAFWSGLRRSISNAGLAADLLRFRA
jgi:hypothetical protein